VRRHLVEMGGRYRAAQRKPHDLTTSQKGSRVAIAKELLLVLRDKKKWPSVVTGDESWVYYVNSARNGWVLPGDEQFVAVDRNQGDKKVMLVVFFSTSGFKAIRFLLSGEKVNADYCQELFGSIARDIHTPFWLHMDNARPHRAKSTVSVLESHGIISLPHPPYSPDLAPSDFWLFGRLKNALGSTHFGTHQELCEAVEAEIHKIKTDEIRRVYNEWIRRLELCIEHQGEYVHTL